MEHSHGAEGTYREDFFFDGRAVRRLRTFLCSFVSGVYFRSRVAPFLNPPPLPQRRRLTIPLGLVSTLGLSTLPLASYAVTPGEVKTNASEASDTATVSVEVTESISLQLSDVELNLDTVDSTKVAEGTITATVNTNNAKGYTLKLAASSSNDVNMHGSGSNTIPAITGTTLTKGTSAYGYKTTSDYAALTEGGAPIADTSAVANDAKTVVTFGVAVDATVPADNYQSEVVFTATAK